MADSTGISNVIMALDQLANSSPQQSYMDRVETNDLIGVATATKNARDRANRLQLQAERDKRSHYTHEVGKISQEIINFNKMSGDMILSGQIDTQEQLDGVKKDYTSNISSLKERYKDQEDLLRVINQSESVMNNTFDIKAKSIADMEMLTNTIGSLDESRQKMMEGNYGTGEGVLDVLKNVQSLKESQAYLDNEALQKTFTVLEDEAEKRLYITRALDSYDVDDKTPGMQLQKGANKTQAGNLKLTVDNLVKANRIDDAYSMLLQIDTKENKDLANAQESLNTINEVANEEIRVRLKQQVDLTKKMMVGLNEVDAISDYGIGDNIASLSTDKGDWLSEVSMEDTKKAYAQESAKILKFIKNEEGKDEKGLDVAGDSLKEYTGDLNDEGKLLAIGGYIRKLDDRSWVWNTKKAVTYKNKDGNLVKGGGWGQLGDMTFNQDEVLATREKLRKKQYLNREGDEDKTEMKEAEVFNAFGDIVLNHFNYQNNTNLTLNDDFKNPLSESIKSLNYLSLSSQADIMDKALSTGDRKVIEEAWKEINVSKEEKDTIIEMLSGNTAWESSNNE